MSISDDDMPERSPSREATWEANKYYFEHVLSNAKPEKILFWKNKITLQAFITENLTEGDVYKLFKYAVDNEALDGLQLCESLAETYANIKDGEYES